MNDKFKKFFLDEKYLLPSQKPVAAGAPDPSTNRNHPIWLSGGVAASVFALILSIIFSGASPGAGTIKVDPSTLCPDPVHIVSETYIHIDLSEKLTPDQRGWLQELLQVAQNSTLPKYSLFSISQMQTKPKAPRVEVLRFCIPDIEGIRAGGISVSKDDCPEIAEEEFDWEQNKFRHFGQALREKITGACEVYVELKGKVQEAADRYKIVSLEQSQSYIVGSIEDVLHATARDNSRISTQLIVFSDMLQNAKWFSQYNIQTDKWTAKNLKKLRKSDAAVKELGGKPPPANLKFDKVLLCAIPSTHSVLANARSRNAHKAMWEKYFKDRVMRPNEDNLKFRRASACAVAAGELMKQTH